jgi:hypothetical protein
MHSEMSIGSLGHITLAITWPQGLRGEKYSVTAAAQVHGGVS